MTYEGFRLKINKYRRKLFAKIRKKSLIEKDFTLISNNCWGGMVYESYDLPKQSPTVGLFFMAKDYIKFLSDIKAYTSAPLNFIDPTESKYVEFLKQDKRFGSYPIGKINDIEIMFLHYHSEKDAAEKWKRRCERINWNRLIVKFNDQNECTEEEVKQFSEMNFKNKLFFTIKDWKVNKWEGYCVIRQYTKDDSITASHELYGVNPYLNITKYINRICE